MRKTKELYQNHRSGMHCEPDPNFFSRNHLGSQSGLCNTSNRSIIVQPRLLQKMYPLYQKRLFRIGTHASCMLWTSPPVDTGTAQCDLPLFALCSSVRPPSTGRVRRKCRKLVCSSSPDKFVGPNPEIVQPE